MTEPEDHVASRAPARDPGTSGSVTSTDAEPPPLRVMAELGQGALNVLSVAEAACARLGMRVVRGCVSGVLFASFERPADFSPVEWEVYLRSVDEQTLTLSPRRTLVRLGYPPSEWFAVVERR